MVKLFEGGWAFMKRTRRDEEGEGCCTPSSSKDKQVMMTMMELDGGPTSWRRRNKKGARRGVGFIRSWNGKEHHTVADTLSLLDSTDATLGDEAAAWRVGPPIESDWWEEEEEEEVESCSSSSSSSLDLESDETPPDAVGTDSTSSSSPKRRVRFRNVGYLTWQQVQHNWKSSGGSLHGTQDSDPPAVTRAAARPPTPNAKRELVKGLANNRQYEMKHRVRLPDLLAIYNEMWTEEWSD